jgi:predicted enzyme related to lactoylglutathione lyase
MNKGFMTVVYPVSDLAAAKSVFSTLLGVEPLYDDPYYVGYVLEGQNNGVPVLGLDPNGHDRGMTGAVPFWEVDDIRGAVAALVAAGATIVEDVHEVGGGGLVAILEDPDCNMIGFSQ